VLIHGRANRMGLRGKCGLVVIPALLGVLHAGCMENEMIAPEEIDDPDAHVTYFPGRGLNWKEKTASELGWDQATLADAVDYAVANEADIPTDLRGYLESRFEGLPDQDILGPLKERGKMNGMILHRGYIVAEWGDTARTDVTFSVTKSLLGTTVGLALDRELIRDVDDLVAEYVDDGGYASPHNAMITWRHTLQQSSEWEGTLWGKPDTADRREGRDRTLQDPGTFWEYNDVRVNRAALSAARVWGESLPEVLDREFMTPIGASRSWRWHGYRNSTVEIAGQEIESVAGGGHWGGGMWISTRDMARVGLLYLRRGMWREERVLSEEFIDAALTPSELNPTYGYMWWLNTEGALWPSAPHESFAARGGGDNMIWVDPVNELVVVVRWIERGTQDGLLERILAAAPPARRAADSGREVVR